MILKADAAQLEWRVKAYLAQDQVAIREILNGEDLHTDNQKAFGLPERVIAKIFVYRMIFADAFGEQGYKKPAWSYANDPDFMKTSTSKKYWERVVGAFFDKYQGMHTHSIELIREAVSTGQIVSPSGRIYKYRPVPLRRGGFDWPRTTILNYIVQGFSADIMILCRKIMWKRVNDLGYGDKCLFINTVHDDVELDCVNDPEIVFTLCKTMESSFRDIPKLFEKDYGTVLNVPMAGECKFGMSLYEKDMSKFNSLSFQEDWKKLLDKHK